MEMFRKIICLIAIVSVLSLPAIARSQSDSEIKDHGMQYMDCIYDAGFTRGPTSEDANDDDSGVMLPPPLEYRNDEGSCGLSLPDSTEHKVPSPSPQSPLPPIPPDEDPEDPEPPVKIPDITTPDLTREPDESNDDKSLVDPNDNDDDIIEDIPDSNFGGPQVGIPINPGSGDDLSGPGEPIPPNGGGNQVTGMTGEVLNPAGYTETTGYN